MIRSVVEGWWRRRDVVPARTGWINLAIGLACAVCVAADWRLGLASVGRWYLGYFAVILVAWGAVAIRLGREGAVARPLRLAGDLLGWAGLIGFAVIGLLLDPAEYPALWTLVAFALVVAVGTVVARRRTAGGM